MASVEPSSTTINSYASPASAAASRTARAITCFEAVTERATEDAAVAAMREHRVPMAPILSVEEAVRHPHLRERGTVRTVRDRILGDFEVPGFALRFSDFPERLKLDAPLLGEHNEEILTKVLGYPVSRVRELEGKGVLHSAPY